MTILTGLCRVMFLVLHIPVPHRSAVERMGLARIVALVLCVCVCVCVHVCVCVYINTLRVGQHNVS